MKRDKRQAKVRIDTVWLCVYMFALRKEQIRKEEESKPNEKRQSMVRIYAVWLYVYIFVLRKECVKNK